jgi:hypothetical protein
LGSRRIIISNTPTMATNKTKPKSVNTLRKELSGVITQAKGLGIDTRAADAMVAQTKRQGSKSFVGSKEETGLTKSYKKNPLNTTGITANPKNTEATDAGVVSSEQGVTQLKQYQSDAQKLDVGLGTKDSPLSDTQINELESQGIVEGDTVPGKGRLAPGGYWVKDIPAPKDTAPQPTATYIDPNTGATTTTTGAGAGSDEEKKKMQEKGMSLSESTTTAEDMTDPEIKKAEDEYTALTKEITSYKNKLLDLIITDSDLRADIRGITSAYDARIAEMRNITDRQIQSINTLGYRMGMQFTGGVGGVFGGIISNAEQEGLLKIADIEGQKQETIIKAKAAARDNNYKIYASLMDDARALSTQKATEVANLKKAQKEQDQKIADHVKQVKMDADISALYAEGITDAASIAFSTGNTLADVEKALKILNPPDALKGLDGDYQTYAYLQKIGDPTVSGLSYIDYKRMIANATRAPKEGDKLTVEEQKQVKLDNYALALTTPGATYNTGEGDDYILGEDGYISPKAWKTFISDAQTQGIPRKDFIESFGYLLNPDQTAEKDWEQYQISGAEDEFYTGIKPK